MKQISIEAFKSVLEAEATNTTVDFINVCTPAEYKEKHIPGVRSVPLGEIESHKSEFEGKQTIYVHCRSGNRSAQAIQKLHDLGVTAELVNVTGGISAWGDAGYITRSLTTRMPIIRQVLLGAGLMVFFGSAATLVIDARFVWFTAAVGAGLAFAGFTGWCGMAFVLAKMPWNR